MASLIWRLDHAQLRLTERTLVVLDEVGMTDDVDLARLAAHVEATGAKLVLTGDDRQLGPSARAARWAPLSPATRTLYITLNENRRQYDTGERRALEALRAGDVGEAISWYAGQSRVHAVATRDDALQAAVEAWSADVAAGHSHRASTPGGGPTWPISTGVLGRGWKPPGGCPDLSSPARAGPPTVPATA